MSNINNRYYLVIEGEDGQLASLPFISTNSQIILNMLSMLCTEDPDRRIETFFRAIELNDIEYWAFGNDSVESLLNLIQSTALDIGIYYYNGLWNPDSLKEYINERICID